MKATITYPRIDRSHTFHDVISIDREFAPENDPTLSVTYQDPEGGHTITREFDGKDWFVEDLSLTEEEQLERYGVVFK